MTTNRKLLDFRRCMTGLALGYASEHPPESPVEYDIVRIALSAFSGSQVRDEAEAIERSVRFAVNSVWPEREDYSFLACVGYVTSRLRWAKNACWHRSLHANPSFEE